MANEEVVIKHKVILDEFECKYKKNEKVISIKQNKHLINIIKQKLGIDGTIKTFFEFNLTEKHNELIGDWIVRSEKDQKVPSVFITLKPNHSGQISNCEIEISGLEFLSLMSKTRDKMTVDKISKIISNKMEEMEKRIEEMANKHNASLAIVMEEMKAENRKQKTENDNLKLRVDELLGFIEIQPLLDLVSNFRNRIVQELLSKKLIPSDCNEWHLMYEHLKKMKKRQLIDEAVEDLGLSSEDWYTLQLVAHKVKKIKHPQPIITKKDALIKLENLKNTEYEECTSSFRNLIDLFEVKKWE